MFSFLTEFVADTTCGSITITEEHISKSVAYTDDKYMWMTRHDVMVHTKAYKYDEGKKHAERILKGTKSKPHPGK